jgi:flavin-dependent dehydrogenase
MRDLLVIGGGPVGLATSLYAAQRGLDVTVLEPRLGPHPATAVIDKACGEGIMPGGLRALATVNVDPVGLSLKGIRYVGAAGRSVETAFRDGPGRGVRRTALHRSLVEAVDRAGVEVAPVSADLISQDGRGVTVATRRQRGGRGTTLRARYVVAADGLHSPARRALGLEAPARPRSSARHGLRRHSAISPWSEHVEVHWSDAGEAYVTPVSADVVGVAVLTDRRVPYDELLRSFPELCDRLDGAPAVSRVMGAGPFRQKAIRRVAGRVLLVGDASGYVDALTGEGIAVGVAQAREAVRSLAAGDPAAYEGAWRRVTWRSATLTQVLVQATRARWGRRLIVPTAERLPGLFRWAVDELAGPL